ncbi:MAG: DUF2225 domain-containing protein [Parachlamydia sp.]|nr:DUF2225 domain-containing protein [Parachlamydia sp.]
MEPAANISPSGRQSLRVRLIEEEVPRDSDKPGFSPQKPNVPLLKPSSVSTWKERGDFHLGRKALDPAIEAYTEALKQAEKEKDTNQLADCLKGLGSTFLEKEQWTFAAKILNASLALYQRQRVPNEIAIKLVLILMADVERRFLEKKCGITKPDLSTRPQIYLERRHKLQELRRAINVALDKTDAVKQTLEAFSIGIGAFLEAMLNEMYPIIGKPPCEFTVLSLGSLARKEMSPYSDLEFAFLVKDSSEENLAYFRTVVSWLEIQVINLGETPIKILDGGYVSPVDRGFSFDDGGNTPLGKPGQIELIKTPVQLAQLQTERFYSEDFILSNVLRTAGLLFGDAILYKEYLQAMETIISMQSSRSSLTLRKERTQNCLDGHLVQFKPGLNKDKQEMPVFNVKFELYRIPNFLIAGLADYFGIDINNSWEKLDALEGIEILSKEGVMHLKKALNEIMHLRMRCHMFYEQECDDVYHPSMQQKEGEEVFILSETDLEKMTQIYRVILPLFRAVQEVCRTQNYAGLAKFDFYDPIFEAQAKIHDDLGRYEDSEKYYLQALALQPDNAALQLEFAYNLIHKTVVALDTPLGPKDEWQRDAVEYSRKALIVAQRTNNKALLAKVKSLEGFYCMNISVDVVTAFIRYQEAFTITNSEYGEEHPATAAALGDVGIACITVEKNMSRGKKYIKKALEIYRSRHIETTQVAFILCHLGLGWLHYDKNNEQKALKYLQAALSIYKKEIGEENSKVATTLYWIGFVFNELGKKKEAKVHYEQALRIGNKFFDKNHTFLSSCSKRIGEINHAPYFGIIHPLDRVEAKMQKQEEELETLIKEHGEEHPTVADFLHQCGMVCDEMTQIPRAIHYFGSALKIKEKLYQNDEHPSLSETLAKLGEMLHVHGSTSMDFYAMWENPEVLKKAIESYTYALHFKKRAKTDVYGDANPTVAATLHKLGLALYVAKDLQASIECLEEAISIYRKVFGDDHDKTQQVVRILAKIKDEQRRCCCVLV